MQFFLTRRVLAGRHRRPPLVRAQRCLVSVLACFLLAFLVGRRYRLSIELGRRIGRVDCTRSLRCQPEFLNRSLPGTRTHIVCVIIKFWRVLKVPRVEFCVGFF